METQKKIREMEIDNDMKIEVVENAFMLMVKYNIQGSYSRNYINLSDLCLRLDLNRLFTEFDNHQETFNLTQVHFCASNFILISGTRFFCSGAENALFSSKFIIIIEK